MSGNDDGDTADPGHGSDRPHWERPTATMVRGRGTRASPSPSAGEELAIGATVDRYVLIGEIGRGGAGVVYAAFDPELGRRVALKVFKPRQSEDGSVGHTNLVREAQALARLSHPNVVQVYDVGSVDGRVFIAMEFIAGRTVGEWLDDERPSWREILAVFVLAGRGLAAAHEVGLAHLDFKPANVVVGRDGEVRVIDFGLARFDDDVGAASETADDRSSGMSGTPGYIAPEQVEGEGGDVRSDQFSYCVSLWEALMRQRPFSSSESFAKSGQLRPPPRDSGVPRWLQRVLLQGLQRDRDGRHASMGALLAELQRDPARARVGGLLAIAVVALAGVAVYGYVQIHRGRGRLCEAAADKLAGIWDGAREAAIGEAFTATGQPFAAAALNSVRDALQSYSSEWIAMRIDACEATWVRGEQSEDLLDRRMTCLDERRDQLAALTTLFADADAALVENSVQAARALSPLDECADTVALSAVKLPSGPVEREKAAAVRSELARAKELEDAGRYKRGLEVARGALDQAKALDYPPYVGQAHFNLAKMHSARRETDLARRELDEALWLADATEQDKMRAMVCIHRVWVIGHLAADFQHGEWIANGCLGIIDRIGGNEDMLARLLGHWAVVLSDAGRYDDAITRLEVAVEIRERVSQPDDLATLINNLGSVYVAKGEYAAALPYYRRALELRSTSLGHDHPMVAVVRGNIGNTLRGLGRYDEALTHLRAALAIEDQLVGDTSRQVAETTNNIAVVLQAMERHDAAADHYGRALSIWLEIDATHPTTAILLNNVGESHRIRGRPRLALAHHRRALVTLERRLGLEHPYVAHALSGIGVCLLELRDVEGAVGPLQRALDIFERSSGDPLQIAESRFALARALVELDHDIDRPLQLARAAREHYATMERPDMDAAAAIDAWLAKLPGARR